MDIHTKRLYLMPVAKEHVPEIFANFNAQVTEYMIPAPASEISETYDVVCEFIKQRQAGTDYVYAIVLRDSNEFVGLVGLHYLKSDIPHLGIWTKLSAQGNHYGREAIGGVIEYAKRVGISKLCYPVDYRNIASKKIPMFYGGQLVSASEAVETAGGKVLQIEKYEIVLD